MRIAFVYDALYPWVKGGGERRYHELAMRLRERHEVHFVSWRWWDGPSPMVLDGITYHGVGRPPALYGGDGKRTVREAVTFGIRVLPTLLRHRWDVIDCSATPYVPLYPVAWAARMTRTRMVVTWHEFWGEHWEDYLGERRWVAGLARRVESGARRLGHRVVAVSEFTARRLELGHDPRLEVIGNGVSVEEIDAEPAARGGADVIYVGRLIDDKRVDLLLEAVHLLRHRLPDLRCSIVGDGPERISLEGRARELGIADRVSFTGQLEGSAIYGHMKAAGVLVLPSLREGFGMTVAEAQACGTVPVVVRSASSAAADLVRDGVDGVLTDATPESLAAGISKLLMVPGRLAAVSQAAREIGQRRGWDAICAQMERIYDIDVQPTATEAPIGRLGWS